MAENKEKFKKVCELSFDNISSLLYGQLKGVLSDNEYDNSWITETYETYFILAYWNDTCKYYKINYTKVNDESVTIDFENKVEVQLYTEWKEIPQVKAELTSLNTKIDEKDGTITSLNATIETLNTEKEEVSNKLTESTNSIADLSKQINEMKPIVETYNKDLYEKLLNQQKTKYEEKFVALNAKEKFESKEVQDLIIKSLNENEVKEAILSLNSMLVDLVKPAKSEVKPVITEPTKSLNNLINVVDNFESRYFV